MNEARFTFIHLLGCVFSLNLQNINELYQPHDMVGSCFYYSEDMCHDKFSGHQHLCGQSRGPQLLHYQLSKHGLSWQSRSNFALQEFSTLIFQLLWRLSQKKKALNLIEISQSRCWVPIQFLSPLPLPLLPQHKNDNGFDRCGSTHLEHSIYLEKDRTLSPPQEKLEKMKDCAL